MTENQQQIKVIVLGDSGVGKSSLLLRFVNDQFNEFNEPTLGAAFISKVHNYSNDKTVRYQVWDTAGQQKYKSIAPIYYRESQVAICVYDITSKDSFQVMKNWVDQLRNKGPEGLILSIVGNKIDKSDDEEVPYTQAKEYAQSINAIFKLTSAKEGKGINELFTLIANKLEELHIQKNKVQQNLRLDGKDKKDSSKKSCCKGQ